MVRSTCTEVLLNPISHTLTFFATRYVRQVIIGQRGDDELISGGGTCQPCNCYSSLTHTCTCLTNTGFFLHLGNNLVIGDAGFNTITSNADFARIYQIYRSMESPAGSNYAPDAEDYGFAFMVDFELYPNPYRNIDSLTSIIGEQSEAYLHIPTTFYRLHTHLSLLPSNYLLLLLTRSNSDH